jgi:hypothetical protein
MKINFLQLLVGCYLFFGSNDVFSQKRIGIYNVSAISSKSLRYSRLDTQSSSVFGAVPAYCVDFYSNNPDFITIDRKNQFLINSERELQKSENFMDGYVVDQGKSEGVDFIVQSVFDTDSYALIIKVLDVKDEKVLCSSERKLDKNFLGIKDLKQQVTGMLIDINSKCFDADIEFVRVLSQKGKKAKEVLIAAGTDLRIRNGYKFEIFKIVEEKVGAKTVKRKQVIGLGEVLKVEDENFSILEIVEGQEEILIEANSKTTLSCKLLTK